MVMRENQMYAKIKTLAEKALSQFAITDCTVMQHAQPLPTSDHAAVIISKIQIHRYGWQGSTYEKDNGKSLIIDEIMDYIDECTFQLSAFVPRNATDTQETLTSYDILSALTTYFNSYGGICDMKKEGLQPLRVTDIRTPVQQDDSSSPQYNPNFDLKFMVHQTPTADVPCIGVFSIGGGPLEDEDGTSAAMKRAREIAEEEEKRKKAAASEVIIERRPFGLRGV